MKAGILCSACGCKSDSDHYENTVSLENQDEKNMSDDSSENYYDYLINLITNAISSFPLDYGTVCRHFLVLGLY